MIVPAMISLLVGMVLAQRFRALIMVPTIPIALTLTIGIGVALADAPRVIILMCVLEIVSLQIGYFVGVSIRYLLKAARPNPKAFPSIHCPPSGLHVDDV
jgi:hypothetical protein